MKEVKQIEGSLNEREALSAVLSHFEQFKAANDERLKALELKRYDGLLDEKLGKIENALSKAEERLNRLSKGQNRPVLGHGQTLEEKSQQQNAFGLYLKSGVLDLELKASISGASGSGVLAPAETEAYVERRLAQISPMRSLASVRTIGSSVFKKPVSTTAFASGWVSEEAARPETDPGTLETLSFSTGQLFANPSVTQDILNDAYINLDEWLASEIEDSFASQETQAFINGDGVNKPRGILNYPQIADATAVWGQVGFVTSGAASDFTTTNPADRLIDLIYAPLAKYRQGAHFLMNKRTASRLRKFKDSDGTYIWQPALIAQSLPNLLGYPVVEIEAMPDVAANSFPIAFGDFNKAYLIVDRAGLSVLRDPYSAKPYVRFYTTKRVGGGVQNFDAYKLMRIAV